MGRRRSQKEADDTLEKAEAEFSWPWELTIDIGTLDPPKIAFLSGHEREYFPEKPGHSRHGIEYAMNCHPGDVPNPNYYPPEDKLLKPVSLLGYGIGGLLAPRFAKLPHETTTILKYGNKDKDEEGEDAPSFPPGGAQQKAASGESTAAQKKAAALKKHELLKKKCSPLSFGTMKYIPRFGRPPRWTCVGVGNYDYGTPNLCKKIGVFTSFGKGPIKLLPPTSMECSFENFRQCCECGSEQRARDYYKSVKPVSLPKVRYFPNEAPENTSFQPAKDGGEGTPSTERMLRPQIVCICRKCFCRVMREGHSFWKKYDLATKFQKTRHCTNIHEHNNLPVFTHKVSCKLVRDLARKEALMARYFDDSCAKVIKEINNNASQSKKAQWGKPVPV